MKGWYTPQELVCFGLPGLPKTVSGLIRQAKKSAWRLRKCEVGKGFEYAVESLPEETQSVLRAAESRAILAQSPLALDSVQNQTTPLDCARNQARPPKPVEDEAALAAARAEGDAKAAHAQGKAQIRMDARLEILCQFDRFCRENPIKGSRTLGGTFQKDAFVAAWHRGEIDSPARALFPLLSGEKLRRWADGLRRNGLYRLAGKYGNRKGMGLLDTQPELATCLRALMCEFPHIKAKRATEYLYARYSDSGLLLPSDRTIARAMKAWKAEAHSTFTRLENPDRWKSRYESALGDADQGIVRLNQEWQADSTPADLLLADGRHMLLFLVDVYSRRLKIHVSKTSTAAAVAHILRRGLLDWGVPERIKTDNGQDYVAHHIQRILRSLEIEHIRCLPFEARGKGFVERVIRTFSHDLMELLPGYIGHSVAERQRLREREQFADRLYTKNRKISLTLTAAELQQFCDRWVRAYENTPHSGLNERPLERVAGWRDPIRRIENERALDLLLAPTPGRNQGWYTVQKTGSLVIEGVEYFAVEFALVIKERVFTLYDPEDAGKVIVFDAKGTYLTTATAQELSGIGRAEIAAKQRAVQREDMQKRTAQMRAEAKKMNVKDAAFTILAERERKNPLVAFPGPSIEHTTPHLDAAKAALDGQTVLTGGGFTPEQARAMGYCDPPPVEEPPAPVVLPPLTQFENFPQLFRVVFTRCMAGQEQPGDPERIVDYYDNAPPNSSPEKYAIKTVGWDRFCAWKNDMLTRGASEKAAAQTIVS